MGSTGYQRNNAFYKQGWLLVVTAAEHSVWAVYQTHANEEGLAWPSNTEIAFLIGHGSKGHISAIRKRLAEYGLLEIVQEGGGGRKRWEVRMLLPPKPPIQDSLFEGDRVPIGGNSVEKQSSHSGNSVEKESSRFGVPRVPAVAQESSRFGARNKDEQTKNRPLEETIGSAGKPRGPEVGEEKLASAGVKGPSKRAASGRERKLDDGQYATREAFIRWWSSVAWPERNGGVEYPFGSRDGKATKTILESGFVAWDLAKAQDVARAFLSESDQYLVRRGHLLYDLTERLPRFLAKAAQMRQEEPRNGNGTDSYRMPVRTRIRPPAEVGHRD
ncbi:MAG: hypothetical protein H0V67_09900 [Geodermatophilaceae bacterium]|nr:hypothetical protein [Geodermatophilaceae bacterium]